MQSVPAATNLVLDNDYQHGCHNSSQQEFKIWKDWTIGSYVYARRPVDAQVVLPWGGRGWTDHPVVLIDIRKDVMGTAQFVVAHLYTRNQAFQYLLALKEWVGFLSLLAWPKKLSYVLSNRYEIVYEWQLRTWTRSMPPSVALMWMFNIRTCRLETSNLSLETDLGRALNFKRTFPHFLELPIEVRDYIYENALRDERQQARNSLIYIRSIHRRRYVGNGRLSHGLCTPALGPLPKLQTPGLLLVSRRVRQEGLHTIYRTKWLVVTITSAYESFGVEVLPDVARFSHVRFDLVLFSVTSEILQRCLRSLVRLLRTRTLRPAIAEVRISQSHLGQAAETCERAYLDMLIKNSRPTFIAANLNRPGRSTVEDMKLIPCVIADGMRELALFCREQQQAVPSRPLSISWGVNKKQKRVGDYSCGCTYLSAAYLEQVWSRINDNGSHETGNDPAPAEETCHHMGFAQTTASSASYVNCFIVRPFMQKNIDASVAKMSRRRTFQQLLRFVAKFLGPNARHKQVLQVARPLFKAMIRARQHRQLGQQGRTRPGEQQGKKHSVNKSALTKSVMTRHRMRRQGLPSMPASQYASNRASYNLMPRAAKTRAKSTGTDGGSSQSKSQYLISKLLGAVASLI